MANSPEKMRVLDLLEAGKITAEEATGLLAVLNAPTRLITKETRENMEEKLQKFAKECNKAAKEIGCKVKEAYTKAEPKIKRVSKTALEKAADALDNLACTINESLKDEDAPPPADDEPVEN